jgi:hypothetical protein
MKRLVDFGGDRSEMLAHPELVNSPQRQVIH